jgi:hypothetical protein
MSMRRLPPVLCFHAKRFEHHLAGGGRKLDTPLLCAPAEDKPKPARSNREEMPAHA